MNPKTKKTATIKLKINTQNNTKETTTMTMAVILKKVKVKMKKWKHINYNKQFNLYFPCLETLILIMPTTATKFDSPLLLFPPCNTLKNIHLKFSNFPINASKIKFHESLNIENLKITTGCLSSMNYNGIQSAFQIATQIKHLSNLIIDPSYNYK